MLNVLLATFSPDGRQIMIAFKDKARLLTADGRLVAAFSHKDQIDEANFSPDGSQIVTASDDKTAKIWTAKRAASSDTRS